MIVHQSRKTRTTSMVISPSFAPEQGEAGALGNLRTAAWLVHPLRGRRMLRLPGQRARRARHELSIALGAPATQHPGSTRLTERALEGADAGARKLGGKIDITALATRPHLQHACLLSGRLKATDGTCGRVAGGSSASAVTHIPRSRSSPSPTP